MSSRKRPEAKEIRLRLLDSRDRALYLFAFTDRGMMRFVGEPVGDERAEKAFSRACASNLMQNLKARTWVVEVGPSGDAAGLLSVSVKGASAEIGGMILPRWQGLGISGSAFPIGIAEAFSFSEIDEMVIRFSSENGLAAGLMPKIGFLRTAESHPDDGLERWVLRRDEWERWSVKKRSANSGQ